MRKILFLMLFLVMGLVFYNFSMVSATDKGPAQITFETKFGKVTFQHHEHQDKLKIDCGECHHGKTADGKQAPYKPGQKLGKCKECHNKSMANIKLNSPKKALHKNCKGCHKQVKSKYPKAPVRCKECHIK